jgi:probable rRNA maturation factor
MPVVLGSRLKSRRLRLSRVRSLAGRILRAVGAAHADLSLLLVGDRFMQRLNRLYRRKDCTTDVLAFPVRKHSGRPSPRATRLAPDLLGDIVISLPQAERQAAQAGHTLERELAILMIHGLLHLLGYDHERSAREARRMSRRERAIARVLRLRA